MKTIEQVKDFIKPRKQHIENFDEILVLYPQHKIDNLKKLCVDYFQEILDFIEADDENH
jgi:hypothetical protein